MYATFIKVHSPPEGNCPPPPASSSPSFFLSLRSLPGSSQLPLPLGDGHVDLGMRGTILHGPPRATPTVWLCIREAWSREVLGVPKG